MPYTAAEYTRAGLPWFDYYDDNNVALDGAKTLKKMKSITAVAKNKGDNPIPENGVGG